MLMFTGVARVRSALIAGVVMLLPVAAFAPGTIREG